MVDVFFRTDTHRLIHPNNDTERKEVWLYKDDERPLGFSAYT